MTRMKVVVGALIVAAAMLLPDEQGGRRAPPLAQPASPAPAGQAPAFEPADETPEDLPAGNGRDETFYACMGCHGTAIVKAQGMRRDQWNDTLNWMVEKHRMPEPDAATRDLVLDYLAATFPARPAQQRGWVNPFLNRQSQ